MLAHAVQYLTGELQGRARIIRGSASAKRSERARQITATLEQMGTEQRGPLGRDAHVGALPQHGRELVQPIGPL